MAHGIQRRLTSILARELTANVATPFLVLDRDGMCVASSEPAEQGVDGTAAEPGRDLDAVPSSAYG